MKLFKKNFRKTQIMRICSFLFLPVCLQAENLVSNSSFELDLNGFSCERNMFLKTNPAYVYTTPEFDSASKVHGNQSLKLTNPLSDMIILTSKEFRVEVGKEYNFSFWVKSETENIPVTAGIMSVQSSDWKMRTYAFKSKKTWKRYQLKAKIPKGHDFFHVYIKIPAKARTIWLDAIQVSSGSKLEEYTPKANIEMAMEFSQFYYIKDSNKPLSGKITAVNYTSSAKNLNGKLLFYDDYAEKLIENKEMSIELPGNKVITKNFIFNPQRYSPYRAEVDFGAIKAILPAYTVVTRKIEKKSIDLNKTTCVGVNSPIGTKRLYQGKWKQPSRIFRGQNMGQRKLMKLYAAQGLRWLRVWCYTIFDWSFIESQKGKFNWEAEDYALKVAEENGFKIMPVLGGWSFSDIFMTSRKKYCAKFLPDFVTQSARILPANNPSHASKGFKVYLPNINDWRDYIRAIASRYKGRISHYEIMNEPNLYLTPEQYLPYLKAAYEVCKSIDPACKIVGMSLTGDHAGKPMEFSQGCYELGALEYMDILSFHPYSSGLESSKIPASRHIAKIKELLKKYNKPNMPVWNDEMFYLYSGDEVIRRFLIDLGSGVAQSASLKSVTKNILNPKSKPNSQQIFPDSIFLANNTLTALFEGAKPLSFNWDKPVTCYLFEKQGERIAAVWSYNPRFNFFLRLSKGSLPVKIYDLFGNELPNADKNIIETKLSKSPIYIKCPGLSAKEFADYMRKAQIISDTPAAIMGSRLKTGNNPELVIELKNTTNQQVNGVIKQKTCPEWLSFDVDSIPFSLQPMATSWVYIPVKIKLPATGQAGKIEINVIVGNKENVSSVKIFNAPSMPASRVASEKMRIDGKLEEKAWQISAQAEAGTDKDAKTILYKNWNGSKDCSAIFKVCYDNKYLYISAQIHDDIAGDRETVTSPWTGDALELFIDTKPFKKLEKMGCYTDSTYQIVFAPPSPKYPAPKHNVRGKIIKNSDIQWSYIKNANGYTIESAIPLKSLGITNTEKKQPIAIDFAVDDADKQNYRDSQIIWSGTKNNFRDRSKFGYLYFE
jgi:cellulose/xylan binding protein with CBM9 domain/carbohydrate binding protein with CBM4/9 domain